MNLRRNEINDLFHFLEEAKENESNFDLAFEKLEKEIIKESARESDINKNEYLDELLKVKIDGLKHYLSVTDYYNLIDYFQHVVTLHGLGVAQ